MSSPEEQLKKMVENLPEKTGKDLDEWLRVIEKSGLHKHGEIVGHLKQDHGVTHGYANLLASEFLKITGDGQKSPEELVDAQYAGPKSGLRPIYDTLVGVMERLGDDVEISPKKTYVSFRRNKQFALLQPSTRSRADLGLNLPGEESTERLEPSGSFNAMVSHRVRLEDAIEIDSELKEWLKQAYDQA
ncbi:MAG: DUF4287 domain-containing protein [Xanthomonadales bacterium]|nr:DUF4287 domain-containing protein [Xanthomonadales bacterium]